MEKIISVNFRAGISLLFSGGFVEFSGIIQLFSWLIWETKIPLGIVCTHKNDKRNCFFFQNAQASHVVHVYVLSYWGD